MEEGLFRKDLFFRIGVIKVKVPSLNDRRNDIMLLAEHFLCEFNKKFGKAFTGISPQAEKALMNHDWTGNVRELKNLIEKGVLIGNGPSLMLLDLGIEDTIPATGHQFGNTMIYPIPPEGVDLSEIQRSLEQYYINEALRIADGNECKAAKLLNINHHTFRYRRKKLQKI